MSKVIIRLCTIAYNIYTINVTLKLKILSVVLFLIRKIKIIVLNKNINITMYILWIHIYKKIII